MSIDRPRLIRTGTGYADHIGDAIAGYVEAGYDKPPVVVPEELGSRPARVIRTAAQVQADTGAAVIRRTPGKANAA